MLNHITTNQCRMLLQEANFIKKQYPKRIKEFQEILKEDRSLIEMSVDISAKISTNTGGHTGEIKDLENERIKNQILIRNLKTEILYMDNRLLQIKILENMMIRQKVCRCNVLNKRILKEKNHCRFVRSYISVEAHIIGI